MTYDPCRESKDFALTAFAIKFLKNSMRVRGFHLLSKGLCAYIKYPIFMGTIE